MVLVAPDKQVDIVVPYSAQ